MPIMMCLSSLLSVEINQRGGVLIGIKRKGKGRCQIMSEASALRLPARA
jgi:hypothetical protein